MKIVLGEDRADDGLDGLDAQVELLTDRRVREALRQELEHLLFAGTEFVEVAGALLSCDDVGQTLVFEDEGGLGGEIDEQPFLSARQGAIPVNIALVVALKSLAWSREKKDPSQ